MSEKSRALRVLLVGASGAVGQEALKQALAHRDIARVVALTRRPLGLKHAKLVNPVIDFSALPDDATWWVCDAMICTLGTTIRQAGSAAAFAAIDRDLPLEIARRAQTAGATRCALNSSLGASPKGNFYLRTKAEAEQGIIALGFTSTTIVRPSLIDADRTDSRPAERAGILVARVLRPLIPQCYRPVTPHQIAHALVAGIVSDTRGLNIIESDQLLD